MFQTLLESRASRARRVWGMSVSVGAHTTAIALAIAATARATAAPPIHSPEPTDIVWAAPPAPALHRGVAPTSRGTRQSLDIVGPRIRTVDLPSPPTGIGVIRTQDPIAFDGGDRPLARGVVEVDGRTRFDSSGRIYELPMVEKAAMPQPGNPAPVYPAALRAAQLEGDVVARFVVDTSGRAEPGSIAFPRVSHPAFAEAVRHALLQSRYVPAEVAGHSVRQLVEQRFLFALRR